MSIDSTELFERIQANQAAAQAKKAGAQISPEVAATIRQAWRNGIPISVIRVSLRQMDIAMSPTMVSRVAKSATPRKKRNAVAQVSSASGAPAAPVRSGVIDPVPPQPGETHVPSATHASADTNNGKTHLAGLTAANMASRQGGRR